MTPPVQGFLLKALHVFQVRTLASRGFGTRVALSNKSQEKGRFATDYRVDLTVYSPDGTRQHYHEAIGELPAGGIVRFDCAAWQDPSGADQVMVFHLMPRRLLGQADAQGGVDIGRDEIWSLFTAQDHYVEYFRPDGFSSGVLYQSGAFNYSKFSREETTVIQAPKVYLSGGIDTLLSVLHTSFEPGWNRVARLRLCLLDPGGAVAARWVERIEPFTCRTISLGERVGRPASEDTLRFYTLLALSDNAALLPLVLNHDAARGTLAVEHSLPPLYYGQAVTGHVRAGMVQDLKRFAPLELADE